MILSSDNYTDIVGQMFKGWIDNDRLEGWFFCKSIKYSIIITARTGSSRAWSGIWDLPSKKKLEKSHDPWLWDVIVALARNGILVRPTTRVGSRLAHRSIVQ